MEERAIDRNYVQQVRAEIDDYVSNIMDGVDEANTEIKMFENIVNNWIASLATLDEDGRKSVVALFNAALNTIGFKVVPLDESEVE